MTPWCVVFLDSNAHRGRARLVRMSEGEAAVYVTQQVLSAQRDHAEARKDVTVRLLESLRHVSAFRAQGSDPAGLAAALEGEALQ